MKNFVYKIHNNINDKVIVGMSQRTDNLIQILKNDLAKSKPARRSEELQTFYDENSNTVVFTLEIVAELDDRKEALKLRRDLLKQNDNYNTVKKSGKESPNYLHNKDRSDAWCACGGPKKTRAKQCQKCYLSSDKFKTLGVGRKASEESKKLMSKKAKGRSNTKLNKPMCYYGKTYASLTSASMATGVSMMTLSNCARNPDEPNIYYLPKND